MNVSHSNAEKWWELWTRTFVLGKNARVTLEGQINSKKQGETRVSSWDSVCLLHLKLWSDVGDASLCKYPVVGSQSGFFVGFWTIFRLDMLLRDQQKINRNVCRNVQKPTKNIKKIQEKSETQNQKNNKNLPKSQLEVRKLRQEPGPKPFNRWAATCRNLVYVAPVVCFLMSKLVHMCCFFFLGKQSFR